LLQLQLYKDMTMSQHEQAFTAAVNIIRSMPKDGTY